MRLLILSYIGVKPILKSSCLFDEERGIDSGLKIADERSSLRLLLPLKQIEVEQRIQALKI
jgi:hypothetical protein